MSDTDLEARIRAGRDALPGPDADVAQRALERLTVRPRRGPGLRTWTGRVVGGGVAMALVAVIALLIIAVPDTSDDGRPGTVTEQGGVPDLTGLSLDAARRSLFSTGIELGRITARASESALPGTVIGQSPAAGEASAARDAVDVEIASPGGTRPAAPALTFTVIDDGSGGSPVRKPSVSLADLRGDVVVIAFMASWCEPCRRGADRPFNPETSTDLPRVLQYLSVLESRGVRGLAVAVNDTPAAALALKQRGPAFDSFPLAIDPTGEASTLLDMAGVPGIVVLDREGRIAHKRFGPVAASEVTPVLESLVAESFPPDTLAGRQETELPLSVLDGPTVPQDEVPAVIARRETCAVYLDRVFLAATQNGVSIYFARAPRDQIAMFAVDLAGQGSQMGCGGSAEDFAKQLEASPARGLFGHSSEKRSWSSFVVRDGYDRITVDGKSQPVVNNVAVVEGVALVSEATFTGPAGTFVLRKAFGERTP
jgi:thiol-disulfide isomerase/thioredoxin